MVNSISVLADTSACKPPNLKHHTTPRMESNNFYLKLTALAIPGLRPNITYKAIHTLRSNSEDVAKGKAHVPTKPTPWQNCPLLSLSHDISTDC